MAAKSLSYTVHSVLLKDAVCMEEIMLPKSRFPVFVWLSLRDRSQGVSWKYIWVFFHCSIFDLLWVVMCTQKYVLQSDVIRLISQVFFKTVVLLVFWYLNFHYSHKLVLHHRVSSSLTYLLFSYGRTGRKTSVNTAGLVGIWEKQIAVFL